MIFKQYFRIAVVLLIIVVCGSKDVPSYVLPCSKSDPELNSCIRNSFNHLKGFLPNGLPELGVPPIEPMVIDEMVMENNAGAVRVKARFSNILTKGVSNYTVKEVRNDIKKLRIDMSFKIPRVEATGKYEVSGNVLLLPIRSNGNFWAEFTDISAIARIYGQEKRRGDKSFMHIGKLVIDFTMKNAKFRIEDRLSADNILGEAINQFLNQNAKEIVQEMRPAASQSIAKLIQRILNSAFSQIELKDWLLE